MAKIFLGISKLRILYKYYSSSNDQSNNFSDPMANVKQKAKSLIPEVYNVQFHFYKNNLPKLPNGKYDGVSLIKTIDF